MAGREVRRRPTRDEVGTKHRGEQTASVGQPEGKSRCPKGGTARTTKYGSRGAKRKQGSKIGDSKTKKKERSVQHRGGDEDGSSFTGRLKGGVSKNGTQSVKNRETGGEKPKMRSFENSKGGCVHEKALGGDEKRDDV